MLIIKWTQPNGIISLIETRIAAVTLKHTPAFDEYKEENPDLETENIRGLVFYDKGTIVIHMGEVGLYIVNENGKTVQTV